MAFRGTHLISQDIANPTQSGWYTEQLLTKRDVLIRETAVQMKSGTEVQRILKSKSQNTCSSSRQPVTTGSAVPSGIARK